MEEVLDLNGIPVKAVLLIANIADGIAHRLFDLRRRQIRPANLTGNHNSVCGGQCFTGHTHICRIHAPGSRFPVIQIDDFIRYAVTDLVGMPFGYGFTGKRKV